MPFLIAFAVAAAATPVAAVVSRLTGFVDRADGNPLKIHRSPVPVLGGVAVLGAVLASMAATDGGFSASIAGAAGLVLAVGLVDDRRGLPAWALASSAAAAGLILTTGGASVDVLGGLDRAGVVVLAVACASAVNLLDGQDGLAGGVSAAAALGLAGLAPAAAVGWSLSLGGALAGFLVWNRPEARIFLGNGGALAVGVLLAAQATGVTSRSDSRALLAVAACLGVLLFELAFTVSRRLWSGRPLTAGDRLHWYDLLAARLRSRALVTFAAWAVGGAAAGLGLLVETAPAAGVALVALAAVLALVGGVRLCSVAGVRRQKIGEPALEPAPERHARR